MKKKLKEINKSTNPAIKWLLYRRSKTEKCESKTRWGCICLTNIDESIRVVLQNINKGLQSAINKTYIALYYTNNIAN